ncbi:DsbA family protein [Rhodosalinus halophilus]|uniref:DsbA family protein n=1 Tax=Rhodosalinus halophilus TaxID=2259333 RepID=A0A365UAV4_9RHOB|nr:DsbA family protein [Rhodosalinus halophilus]RBI86274.1 DsbA family protein [Rhodosalinus halophilus]
MTRKLLTAALAAALLAGTGWAPLAPAPVAAQAAEAAEVTEMTMGDPEAPVEVIEYASYTCPHCATFHENVLPRLKEDYVDTGKVHFIYREVYFDKYGMWASMLARCGGEERFFGITELIYDAQSSWSRAGSDVAVADELRRIGRLAGLGEEQVEACLSDADKLRALVAWYQENATEHGIQATPSFVIDGETYSNMSYADFSEILDEKLGEE